MIKNAKPNPDGSRLRMSDGGGLFLYVGTEKVWRFRYVSPATGQERFLTIGTYDSGKGTTLAKAREERSRLKALVDAGTDPAEHKEEVARKKQARRSFRSVGEEWWQLEQLHTTPALDLHTLSRNRALLERVFDIIGAEIIDAIDTPAISQMAAKIRNDVSLDLARRCISMVSRIFCHAVETGLTKYDVAQPVQRSLAVKGKRADKLARTPRPAVTRTGRPEQYLPRVAKLMRAIDGYKPRKQDGPFTRAALKFLAITMVRPGEVTDAKWNEIDFDNRVWIIPAARMKMREEHQVPLTRQAIAILRELFPLTGHLPGGWIFATRTHKRKRMDQYVDQGMSENTLNKALRKLGYDTATEQCAHGFRAVASTILNDEARWSKDAIELQLAHCEGGVRADYNDAKLTALREKMMQAYADRLERMLTDNVTPIRKRA
jgi:integrase